MIITSQQVMMLLDIAKGSLKINDEGPFPFPFLYDLQARTKLVNQILNQQGSLPIEISNIKPFLQKDKVELKKEVKIPPVEETKIETEIESEKGVKNESEKESDLS